MNCFKKYISIFCSTFCLLFTNTGGQTIQFFASFTKKGDTILLNPCCICYQCFTTCRISYERSNL